MSAGTDGHKTIISFYLSITVMSIVDRIIPDIVFSWSLQFKTFVLIVGAVILLFSSFIRPETSIIVWGHSSCLVV